MDGAAARRRCLLPLNLFCLPERLSRPQEGAVALGGADLRETGRVAVSPMSQSRLQWKSGSS
ncbi:hypothetical protein E4U24_005329 [Claviceps purpurea]|nr:hypothetical protein E4U24_005329 [Claviceps purpurea]